MNKKQKLIFFKPDYHNTSLRTHKQQARLLERAKARPRRGAGEFLAPLSSQTICLSRHGEQNFHRAYFFVETVSRGVGTRLKSFGSSSARALGAGYICLDSRSGTKAEKLRRIKEQRKKRGEGTEISRCRERDTEKGWQLGTRVERRGSPPDPRPAVELRSRRLSLY